MTAKRFTCSFTSLIYAMLFGLVVMTKMTTSTSASNATELPAITPPPANTFSLLQTQDDPPIEKTRKNIQVLQGVRESQLFLLMHFITASLDTKCDYCHIKNGKDPKTGEDNWIWESDENPKKLVGRRMMKMMMDINRTNFNGENAVTCYTCHRASTTPARLFPLPPRDPLPKEITALPLPSAEQILAKYIAAVGGKDAPAKFQTTVMKGTIERSLGRNGDIEVRLKQPDKYSITMTAPQSTTVLTVVGEEAWVKVGDASRKLSGFGLDFSRRAAFVFYNPIKVVAQPSQLKVLGTEKIGDHQTYVVAYAVNPEKTIKYYFDTQTGLLLRQLTLTHTPLLELPDQVEFDDYRDVDGIKLPFMIRNSNTATYDTGTRRFTEIRHNVAVDDTVFNPTAAPQ